MGLGGLIDDDSGDESSSTTKQTSTTESPETTDREPGKSYILDGWDGPTHSEPGKRKQWTSGDRARRIHGTDFLIMHDTDGTYRGPNPPEPQSEGDLPAPGQESWHSEWVDTTGQWRGKLRFGKQTDCQCGKHVWMKRRAAWMRCPQCARVLIDREWMNWTKDQLTARLGDNYTPKQGHTRLDTKDDDSIWGSTDADVPDTQIGYDDHPCRRDDGDHSSADNSGTYARLTDF